MRCSSRGHSARNSNFKNCSKNSSYWRNTANEGPASAVSSHLEYRPSPSRRAKPRSESHSSDRNTSCRLRHVRSASPLQLKLRSRASHHTNGHVECVSPAARETRFIGSHVALNTCSKSITPVDSSIPTPSTNEKASSSHAGLTSTFRRAPEPTTRTRHGRLDQSPSLRAR